MCGCGHSPVLAPRWGDRLGVVAIGAGWVRIGEGRGGAAEGRRAAVVLPVGRVAVRARVKGRAAAVGARIRLTPRRPVILGGDLGWGRTRTRTRTHTTLVLNSMHADVITHEATTLTTATLITHVIVSSRAACTRYARRAALLRRQSNQRTKYKSTKYKSTKHEA